MDFFRGLFSIIAINLLLSGDNALVIAMASRSLTQVQRKAAVMWGSAGAVILRVILALIAVPLLELPYLRMLGGILLLWIAVDLLFNGSGSQSRSQDIRASKNLFGAVKTILVADMVMSIDNVVAIVAVAQGNVSLLIIGLAVSIPIIVWGSKAVMTIMERWPQVIIAGAAFLGWIGGEMFAGDEIIVRYFSPSLLPDWVIPGGFAAVVLFAEFIIKRKVIKRRIP